MAGKQHIYSKIDLSAASTKEAAWIEGSVTLDEPLLTVMIVLKLLELSYITQSATAPEP